MMTLKNNSSVPEGKPQSWPISVMLLVLAILFFLLSIDMVGGSLTMLGGDMAQSILLATANPFIGLFIGLLSTAMIQSSSTVTSMIVAVVASGYLSLPGAIPMVMGANIGTTLTSTLVSLGFVNSRNQFRKAISAGFMHDFFNIFTVLLLFPLEYYYGTLSYLAEVLATQFSGLTFSGVAPLSIGNYSFSSISRWLIGLLPTHFFTILLSLGMLFTSVKFLSRVIYSRLIGKPKDHLHKYVFKNPYKSFGWGTLITAGVQSSSITTSLLVPLVAVGRISLKNGFPFILGANIGTTITALIAAFNRTEAALTIALVHVIFNLIGVLIFLPFSAIRKIPVNAAFRFGAMTLDSRITGFSYIIFTFFLLPFTLIYLDSNNAQSLRFDYMITDPYHGNSEKTLVLNKVKGEAQILVYGAEKGASLEIGALPDTSFMTGAHKGGHFVSFEGATVYPEQKGMDVHGEYSLKVLTDTMSYRKKLVHLSQLTLLEKVYTNPAADYFKAHLLVDKTTRILVRGYYYDRYEKLIKSIELEAVR